MRMNPIRASLLAISIALLAAPPPLAADSIVNNQCPGDQTAVPGQILNLPLFTVPPQPTTTWITIDCPPPGCESWGHSTERVRLKEPVLAGDEPSVFEREFHNDTMVMWIYELESGGPADMWITHQVSDDLEAGEGPHEYQLKNNSGILTMTENPGAAAVTFSHHTSLKEPLELAAGDVDTDCLARLSNATLRLENTGDRAVRLRIRSRVTRGATDGIVTEGRIQTVRAWDSGEPEMQSLRLIAADPQPSDRRGDRGVQGPASVIRIEAGGTFEMPLPAAGAGEVLGLSVENMSGDPASLLKSIVSDGRRTLGAGEKSYLLCIGAGDCYDNVTVETPGGALHTEAATARFIDDLDFGVQEMGTANNFDTVRVRSEVLTTLTAARIAGLEWCWTVTFLPNFTLHFQSGNTISMGTTVRVPTTAVPGDQILVWYTWNIMSGATTCQDTCHFHVNVVGGAPEEIPALSEAGDLLEGLDLEQNSPNPFNPVTSIRFRLADPGSVALEIFSGDGRLVRTLADGFLEGGEHELLWDGRNGEGSEVASGTYFYRLVTPEGMRTRRMVLIH